MKINSFFNQNSKKNIIVTYGLVFILSFLIFASVSGKRISHSSKNNHFAYLGISWLNGRLSLPGKPPHHNDWAKIDILTLQNETTVKGKWWKSKGKNIFRTLDGKFIIIKRNQIKHRKSLWYVSFPPIPAVLMLPFTAMWGINTNDVLFTIVFASLNSVLLLYLLVLLKKQGFHTQNFKNMLVLTALFSFGTVNFFSAVRGEVWYTAHIVGMSFLLFYLIFLFSKHFVIAGFALGAAFMTRTPMLLAGILTPFFLFYESNRKINKEIIVKLIKFSFPVLLFLITAMMLNYLRFRNPFEFGHNYLDIRWHYRIERYGLFSYEYLSRNLSAAFTLLPRLKTSFPYIQISPHGMALWLTTPVWFFILWSKGQNSFRQYIEFTVFPIFLLVLLYQNTGFVQFGYRFSLDFTVLLIILLAMDERKKGKLFYALCLFSFAINLFGAITFGRYHSFYPPGSFFFFTM